MPHPVPIILFFYPLNLIWSTKAAVDENKKPGWEMMAQSVELIKPPYTNLEEYLEYRNVKNI